MSDEAFEKCWRDHVAGIAFGAAPEPKRDSKWFWGAALTHADEMWEKRLQDAPNAQEVHAAILTLMDRVRAQADGHARELRPCGKYNDFMHPEGLGTSCEAAGIHRLLEKEEGK